MRNSTPGETKVCLCSLPFQTIDAQLRQGEAALSTGPRRSRGLPAAATATRGTSLSLDGAGRARNLHLPGLRGPRGLWPTRPCPAPRGGWGQAPSGRPGLGEPSQSPRGAWLQRGLTDRLVTPLPRGDRAAAAVPASPPSPCWFCNRMQRGPREGQKAFESTACPVKVVQ